MSSAAIVIGALRVNIKLMGIVFNMMYSKLFKSREVEVEETLTTLEEYFDE